VLDGVSRWRRVLLSTLSAMTWLNLFPEKYPRNMIDRQLPIYPDSLLPNILGIHEDSLLINIFL
jgi:hypothetical protein